MICSYQQPPGRDKVPIYHRHSSSRQARVLQGAENSSRIRSYLCPTCQMRHNSVMDYGLDICLSDSTLHEFHLPKESGVVCPPDSSHVDWLTTDMKILPSGSAGTDFTCYWFLTSADAAHSSPPKNQAPRKEWLIASHPGIAKMKQKKLYSY